MVKRAATASPMRLLYSKREAAQLLSLSERTLHNLVAAGTLPTRQIGRRRLIAHEALVEFASKDHPEEPTPRLKKDLTVKKVPAKKETPK